jgi:hypothetical protein
VQQLETAQASSFQWVIRYLATAKGLFDYLQGRNASEAKIIIGQYLPGFLKTKDESIDQLRMRVTA